MGERDLETPKLDSIILNTNANNLSVDLTLTMLDLGVLLYLAKLKMKSSQP